MTGSFPRNALLLADTNARDDGGEVPRGDASPLLWPKEWRSPEAETSAGGGGGGGPKLPVNADLQKEILMTFMNALTDVGLLPLNRGAQGWAPPTKNPDALLSSAAEARAARTGGLAPEPSALEGAPLVLALNWLTFCRGRADAKQGRVMAVACCRRFLLTRPDHPALLEHFLVEQYVPKARTLEDVHDEISRAFDPEGVAAEAVRERGDSKGEKKKVEEREAAATNTFSTAAYKQGGSQPSSSKAAGAGAGSPLPPSAGRLQAVYAFLRFVEMRLGTAAESKPAVTVAAAASRDTVEVARRVLRKALVSMWTGAPAAGRSGSQHQQLQDEDESVRRALAGTKASLFRWADGGGSCSNSGGGHATELSGGGRSHRRSHRFDVPGRNGERQLSTIVFSLWVLGGAPAAVGALDHLLSAKSFSGVSPERRRLVWLQRLEAAVILARTQQRSQVGSIGRLTKRVSVVTTVCTVPVLSLF